MPARPFLKGSTTYVKRHVLSCPRRFDETDDLGYQPLELCISADKNGFREAVLKIARQGVRIITKQDRADSLLAARDEDRTKRTLGNGETNVSAGAAFLKAVGVIPSVSLDFS